MSVTNATQFALIRARRELEKAHDTKNWQAVKDWDQRLGDFLNQAFEDDARDTKALIDELEKVLKTYTRVVSSLAEKETPHALTTD